MCHGRNGRASPDSHSFISRFTSATSSFLSPSYHDTEYLFRRTAGVSSSTPASSSSSSSAAYSWSAATSDPCGITTATVASSIIVTAAGRFLALRIRVSKFIYFLLSKQKDLIFKKREKLIVIVVKKKKKYGKIAYKQV